VFVTGPVGGSILGRHLAPQPRVTEAQLLHRMVDLHAMADVSDGLVADLGHILDESRCGAVVFADAVPVHPDAVELARRTGRPPLDHALGDGEDFELVFTVSPADGERLLREMPVPGLAKVGECVGAGLWLEEQGGRRPLAAAGWVHSVG
jgi:thiamine-monophosphate kinase